MRWILFYHGPSASRWTWLKFAGKPDEDTRTTLKNRWGARWGRRKQAWYIQQDVPQERLEEVLGEPLGVVKDRPPTKTWEYCVELVQLGLPMGESVPVEAIKTTVPAKKRGGDPKVAARLRSMADKMTAQIEEKRAPMTQNWTQRRARMHENKLRDADRMEKVQCGLYGLADAYDNGGPPQILKAIRTKAQIERLVTRDDFPHWADDAARMLRAGIDDRNYAEAHSAMLELANPPDRTAERELRELENEANRMAGQVPGFFPTPRDLAKSMVLMANIQPGARVLEPSAGAGHIADVIGEEHPDAELDVVEISPSLAKLLDAKGYELLGFDFLEMNGDKRWDAVVMNPPFEKLQDIDHVRHAHGVLADGGTLVTIMGEGPFFRDTQKARDFRAWLDEVGYDRQDLEPGTFAPHTNVKANLLVIER